MILSLCSADTTLRIELSEEEFAALRGGKLDSDGMDDLARRCGIDPALLIGYLDDIRASSASAQESEGSCDYTDHL